MANVPGPIRQAQRIVAPQYASVDYASRKAAQRSAAEQAALTASGKALVSLLQKGVGPAGQMYDQAVGQQQALAQGAAQLLAQANPNAQIQGDLAQVNAPAEQHALLAHSLQAQFPGQGAVLNVQQGAIPGASLVAQKAAEQGYLAGPPTLAALSGQQSLRGLLAKAADQQQALQQQRLQISGQIPTLALGIENTRASRAAAAASLAASNAYRQAELDARAQSQNDLNAYRQNEFSQRNASQASLDRYRQRTLDTRTGSKSNPKIIGSGSAGYYTVDPATGKLTQILKPTKTASGADGLTVTQTRSVRAKGNQLLAHVREARAGFKAKDTYQTGANKGKLIYPSAPTYDQAVKLAEQQGIPLEVAVPMLNTIFPAQYQVTNRGLKQTGIRGYPSTFAGKTPKRKGK